MTDKRDLVMNQAEEILLNRLKDHIDNEFCSYVYFELTLGAGIEDYYINHIKNDILRADGTFKVKKNKSKNKKNEQYSMEDLLNSLIYYLSVSLRERVLADREEEITRKYGNFAYLGGIGYYLSEILLGIKSNYSDKHHNDLEKMIEEYILRA